MKKLLHTIGATRWWAKANTIRKILGSFEKDEAASKGLFSDVEVMLSVICDSVSSNQTTRDQANELVCRLLQLDTVLTASLNNRIFSITSPLSEYLQTRDIDLLQAQRMVETSTNCFQQISRDFHTVHDRAVKFCNSNNKNLSLQTSEEQEILVVSTSLLNKRARRRTAHVEEKRDEEVISSPLERYRIDVFCAIMDEVMGNFVADFYNRVISAKILLFLTQGDLLNSKAFWRHS